MKDPAKPNQGLSATNSQDIDLLIIDQTPCPELNGQGISWSPEDRFDEDMSIPISYDESAEEQEVAEIEEKIQKHRQVAIKFGRKHQRFDWDEITKQYVTQITPEEEVEGYMMAMDEDEEKEVIYDTVCQPVSPHYLKPL